MDRVNSMFDSVRKYVESLGKKTEEILPAPISLDGNADTFSGLKTHVRQFDQSYEAPAGLRVSVEGEFGEIRVAAWDERVVRVQADITVGAETTEMAMQIANGIAIGATTGEGALDVRAPLPETTPRVPVEINYLVTVPRDANVTCKNRLGNTTIQGVGGEVTVESTLGRVELRDLAKPAKVWAQGGAQPLFAYGLRQGGEFALIDVQAEFENVGGQLTVSSLMGKTTLRNLAPECRINASSMGGPMEVQLSPNDRPDIEATAVYGDVISDVEMSRTGRADVVMARTANPNSAQRLRLESTSENIAIRVQGMPPTAAIAETPAGIHVEDTIPERSYPAPAGARLVIDAIVGDIRVEGTDDDAISIEATKHVRVNEASKAQEALDALVLKPDQVDGTVIITTSIQIDPAQIGCTSHRVDLTIGCPRTTPIEIRARTGHTTVVGMTAPVKVAQLEGSILAQNVSGDLDLHNSKGEVEALDCGGAIVIESTQGRASTRNAKGRQNITCRQGKVVVDAPLGEVNVRSYSGDVSIIALNGVGGNFDVGVEQGDLSLMLLPTSDALLVATTEGGRVDVHADGLVLTGNVSERGQSLQTRLNNGQFNVILKTKDGNIAID